MYIWDKLFVKRTVSMTFNKYDTCQSPAYNILSFMLNRASMWCLASLSKIFQFHRVGQFYCCRKPEINTDIAQVTKMVEETGENHRHAACH